MKILGIVLSCFVVVIGASVGIFALQGGFENEKINIKDLFLNKAEDTESTTYEINESKNKLTIYTVTDVTTSVSFEPLNATEKNLSVKVEGIDGVLANKDELTSGITAGKDFKIKIRKDAFGNNHGGVVNLSIESPNGLARVNIVVIVDVTIPSNTMYFSGDNNNKVTTTGKAFTLAKNAKETNVYLRSELYNAFSLQVSRDNYNTANGNLKQTEISYVYTSLEGKVIRSHTYDQNELKIVKVDDSLTHSPSYQYVIPILSEESGKIVFTAKTHRSYKIQQEFEKEGNNFDQMEQIFKEAETDGVLSNISKANNLLEKFSEFVNKYISYFDDTEESKYFFMQNTDDNGKISFYSYDSALKALNYVFVSCTAEINVTAVNLDNIISKSDTKTYYVFDDETYFATDEFIVNGSDEVSTTNIIDEFGLELSLKSEDGKKVSSEDARLFDTLEMGAYIYWPSVSGEADMATEMGLKKTPDAYDEIIPVYGFEDGDKECKPITPNILETYSNDDKEVYREAIAIGYLYKLKTSMTSNRYMDINSFKKDDKTYWKIDFNVPLLDASTTTKRLFFRFAINGEYINGNKSQRIDREAFTRIYIDYTRYEYSNNSSQMLTLKSSETESLKKSMALNVELENAGGYVQSTQNVIVDTSSSAILNYNGDYEDASKNIVYKEVEYKSIMYFVESESNTLDGDAKQVATLGEYNFVDFTTGQEIKNGNGDNLLVGERIPTYVASNNVKQFYIQTLNASPQLDGTITPVRVFAVVYLSDKYGNPITLDGKKIEVKNEFEPEEATTIYVVTMSDITANPISINNFVDTVNFYTIMADSINLCKGLDDLPDGITYNKGEWVKRNDANSFVYSDDGYDVELTGSVLKEYKDFLQLKLLKEKEFKLYISNFELGSDGSILDGDSEKIVRVVDINGKEYTERAYKVKTRENKEIAFNNLVNDFSLYVPTGINIVSDKTVTKDENSLYLRYIIIAQGDDMSGALSLKTPTSGVTYSTASVSHKVSFIVNHLEIGGVEITQQDYQMYNSLNASYLSDIKGINNDNRGKVEFKIVSESGDSTPYSPTSAKDISYLAYTNLGEMTDGEFIMNTNIVDPSQAVYEGGDLEEGEKTIKEYIYSYTQGVSNVKTNYSLVTKYAVITKQVVIEKKDIDNKYVWVIGNNTFENDVKKETIDGTEVSYLEINGVKYYDNTYPVIGSFADGSAKFVFPANTYFPVVSKKVKDGNGETIEELVMYLLGEEFVISKLTDPTTKKEYNVFYLESINGNQNYSINVNIPDGVYIEAEDYSGEIERVQFTSSKYINVAKDGDSFELIMGEDTTYVYYEDNSGEYKYDSEAMKFEKIEGSNYDGVRYRREGRAGVMVYLLVSFNFKQHDVGINKVLTFNLKQSPPDLKLLNSEGDENNEYNRLDINAGESTIIYLDSNGKYPAITAKDSNVFGHIEIVSSITGVSIIKSADDSIVTITAENFFKHDSAQQFYIKYLFKGEVLYKTCYINIKHNYDFEYSGDTSDSYYNLSLDAYGIKSNNYAFTLDEINKTKTYDIKAIFESLVRYEGATDCKLELLTSESKCSSVRFDADNMIVGVSTIRNGENSEYLIFSITLTVDGKEEVLKNKFRVEINPTYKVEVSDILKESSEEDNIGTIFNGEDIYNYVTIFAYDNVTKKYSKIDVIKSLVSITAENCSDTSKNISINDGIINIGAISSNDTLVKLTLSYGGVVEYRYVKVYGTKMFYSADGEFDGETKLSDIDAEEVTDMMTIESKHIELTIGSETNLVKLSKYFAFFATDGTSLSVKLVAEGKDTGYADEVEVSKNTTYKIYFAYMDVGSPKYETDSGITITIK